MSDLFEHVTSQQDPFKRLASRLSGFSGYVERQNRRAADQLLRETVARRFDELHGRLSTLQSALIDHGHLTLVDDMENAALAMRTFIDKIRHASYGYSGLFNAVKINEAELTKLYEFDNAFFDLAEDISRALDHVEANLADFEALPAAIRHLTSLARQAVETFGRRNEVILGTPLS